MTAQDYYSPQVLALATEALRVARTSNCTLFAIPDPESDWGFIPESFLGSAEWMFSEEGVKNSRISKPSLQLVELIHKSVLSGGLDLKKLVRSVVFEHSDRVVLFEIVKLIYFSIPELRRFVDAVAKDLYFEDFYV